MPIYVKADKVKSDHTFTQFPITINDNTDDAVPEWGLFGVGSQTGTPTPDAPIQPEFVGVRTGNLFDKDNATVYECYIASSGLWATGTGNKTVRIPCDSNTQYTLSTASTYSAFRITETSSDNIPSDGSPVSGTLIYYGSGNTYTFTTSNTAKYIIFQANAASLSQWLSELMLNIGTTALPYEPYGYKIPIACGGQTVPVYLGQTQTVRRIKKLVLTGEENYSLQSINAYGIANFYIYIGTREQTIICTHLKKQATIISQTTDEGYLIALAEQNASFYMRIKSATASTVAELKTYLAAQYANGTPVTVWYVLATPETGIINEPLSKIGDYADELHSEDAGVTLTLQTGTSNTISIESDLQPSKMNISYYSEGYTDAKKIPMSNPITVTKTSFPAVIKNNLTSSVDSYVIIGNGSQSGTPTPDAPIMPEFVGVRTAQLIPFSDKSFLIANRLTVTCANGNLYFTGDITGYEIYSNNSAWKTNFKFELPAGTYYINASGVGNLGYYIRNYDTDATYTGAFTLSETTEVYFGIYIYNKVYDNEQMFVQCNTGSTALPYEPFGWAEKITCAGQTVPVYLGQTQTVRRVRKLVFDGTEDWRAAAMSSLVETARFYIRIDKAGVSDSALLSSHFQVLSGNDDVSHIRLGTDAQSAFTVVYVFVPVEIATTVDALKSWLAAQYANGTPVTVWYVLATPETAIVNEPLSKIGDYADELSSGASGAPTIDILSTDDSNSISFDSTIQPSSMSLTYKAEVDKVLSSDGTAVYLSSRQ